MSNERRLVLHQYTGYDLPGLEDHMALNVDVRDASDFRDDCALTDLADGIQLALDRQGFVHAMERVDGDTDHLKIVLDGSSGSRNVALMTLRQWADAHNASTMQIDANRTFEAPADHAFRIEDFLDGPTLDRDAA